MIELSRAAVFSLVLLAIAGHIACGSGSDDDDDNDVPHVIYLMYDATVATDGQATSRLMSAAIDGSGTRQILQSRALYGDFSVDPEGKRIALTTNYVETPPGPELLLGDLETGDIERLGFTNGGASSVYLGPKDVMADCDGQQNYLRLGVIGSLDSREHLEYRWGIHCPNAAWSHDSRLAFLANDPDGASGEADLYLRAKDGTVDRVDLPDATAVGSLDWSADDSRVVLAAGETLMLVDVATRDVTALGNSLDPAFSPLDPSVVASVRYEPEPGVDVWRNGEIVAALNGLEGALAWCPGGELVVLLSDELFRWDWASGEKRMLAQLNFEDDRKFIEPSLACI